MELSVTCKPFLPLVFLRVRGHSGARRGEVSSLFTFCALQRSLGAKEQRTRSPPPHPPLAGKLALSLPARVRWLYLRAVLFENARSLILSHSLTFSLIPSWKEIELSIQIRQKLRVICCIEEPRDVRSFICSIELFGAVRNECEILSVQIFENDNSSTAMWCTVILIWELVIYRFPQYIHCLFHMYCCSIVEISMRFG